jgi:hypothetical protein
VGDRLVRGHLELRSLVAGDRAQRGVDAQEAAVERHQRHADRRRLERAPEALLGAVAGGDVGRDAGHAEDAAVGRGEREAQRHVGPAVEDLLEELGAARLEHLRPVVGAEAPAAHSQLDLVAPAAEDLAPRPARDALEFGVDDGEAAVAVLRVEDERRVVEGRVEQCAGPLQRGDVAVALEPSLAD